MIGDTERSNRFERSFCAVCDPGVLEEVHHRVVRLFAETEGTGRKELETYLCVCRGVTAPTELYRWGRADPTTTVESGTTGARPPATVTYASPKHCGHCPPADSRA